MRCNGIPAAAFDSRPRLYCRKTEVGMKIGEPCSGKIIEAAARQVHGPVSRRDEAINAGHDGVRSFRVADSVVEQPHDYWEVLPNSRCCIIGSLQSCYSVLQKAGWRGQRESASRQACTMMYRYEE